MSEPRAGIKSGKASLIGGIVVGVATFILWMVIARDAGADTADQVFDVLAGGLPAHQFTKVP